MRAPLFVAVAVAVVLAGGARADEPTTAEGYLKRGDEHLKAYATDKAIADYSKAIELNSGFAKAYRQRGTAYTSSNKHEEALADLTTAIRLDPKDAQAYLDRGHAYFYLGKTDLSIMDYTTAIQCDPSSTKAYMSRCTAYMSQKDYKAAIADCTTVIGLEPLYPFHYVGRASLHEHNNDLESAIADLSKAIELNPKFAHTYKGRARLHFLKERHDDAIADCTAAIDLSPGYYDFYILRAEVARQKGRLEKATADYIKVVELEPPYAGCVYLIQRKLLPSLFQFDTSKISSEATKAIEQNPKDADAYIRRAVMGGSYETRLADYTTAMKLAPEQAAALHVCRGGQYFLMRRYASAVADYREALQLDPKFKLAETLLNTAVGKMAEYKSKTTLESVRLDEEVFFVTTAVERITYPKDKKKVLRKSLTTRHEVTVADVRRMDVEIRKTQRQRQESSSGNSTSSRSSDSTTIGGGGSVGIGVFSFGGGGEHTWGSGSESGYSSNTLTGWESEFGTTVRTGMEKSRAWTSSVETTEGVEIELIGGGDEQPILVIHQDKYRSGTAKMKINGVVDEVRFAFPVGKDLTWKYVEKSKSEEKK